MKRKDLIDLWNRAISPSDKAIGKDIGAFPWYRVHLSRKYTVDRRYADGGVRYRTEIRFLASDICFSSSQEDELLEAMHQRVAQLCDLLPARTESGDVLYCEMLDRPTITQRVGGASIGETTLRLTGRKEGRMRGIVFFFGEGKQIHAPVGFFSASLLRTGRDVICACFDQARQDEKAAFVKEKLQFSFDRILDAQGQQLLLSLSDRALTSCPSPMARVYFADLDKEDGGRYSCVCLPMRVKIDRMENENEGVVLGGELVLYGKAEKGTLSAGDDGAWQFKPDPDA